jgi:hypothetical protein
LQVEVEPGITAAEVTGAGAHLPGRSGGEHDGFDARDVGGRWLQVPAQDGRGCRRRQVPLNASDALLRGGGHPAWPLARRGRAALGHGELSVGDQVSEPQLQLLIGHGRDPITGNPLGKAFPVYKTQVAERIEARIAALDRR